MKVRATLSALQFKDILPHGHRSVEIDVPEGAKVRDVLKALSGRVGKDVEEFLRDKKMVCLFRNKVLQYPKEGEEEVREGESLIFINPLIGG